MKQYIYSRAEVGISWEDHHGTLRFPQLEVTTDPESADLFVCPPTLARFPDRAALERLPYFSSKERRHVFFCIDERLEAYDSQALLIRCNLKSWMLKRDPNSISWCWPAENYAECMPVPDGGFKYDVSFHGWLSYQTRIESTAACLGQPSLKCDIVGYPDFTGAIYHTGEGIRRRAEFRRSMRESRIALCPDSYVDDFPYRFWEAMSAARIPVLVGQNQVYPFADEIPYSEFSLFINRGESSNVGKIIAQFLKETPDEELIRRGKIARFWWEKLLSNDIWHESMIHAIKKKFDQFGFSY